jgi:hypothetical protein
MKKLGVLLSGRGSNFEAIAGNVAAGKIQAEIGIVISNKPNAQGLERARERGIPAECIPSRGLEREEYDRQVVALLREKQVDVGRSPTTRSERGSGSSRRICSCPSAPRSSAAAARRDAWRCG